MVQKSQDKIEPKNAADIRLVAERKKNSIILSPEKHAEKDTPRQIASALNEITAKIMTKNNNAIGIDIKEISRLNTHEQAQRLSKIREILRICRKTKTRVAVNTTEAHWILLSLGASTQQVAAAQYF